MLVYYILLGYLIYGSIITALNYARGEFEGGVTVWRLIFSVLVEPLNVHFLSPGHWGEVSWASAGKGVLILFLKVGSVALILAILFGRARELFSGMF